MGRTVASCRTLVPPGVIRFLRLNVLPRFRSKAAALPLQLQFRMRRAGGDEASRIRRTAGRRLFLRALLAALAIKGLVMRLMRRSFGPLAGLLLLLGGFWLPAGPAHSQESPLSTSSSSDLGSLFQGLSPDEQQAILSRLGAGNLGGGTTTLTG